MNEDTNDPDALKVSQTNFKEFKNLGNEEYQKGRYEQAIQCYSKAIELK